VPKGDVETFHEGGAASPHADGTWNNNFLPLPTYRGHSPTLLNELLGKTAQEAVHEGFGLAGVLGVLHIEAHDQGKA
jgi:hypothetical protein